MTSERYKKGIEEMHKHYGTAADKYIETIKEFAPEFARVNVEFPFGDLYTRDVLDARTRELVTISALTVQGSSLPQLKFHVKGALKCGATRDEIVEVITQMLAYCGFPAATNALLATKDTFEEIDAG